MATGISETLAQKYMNYNKTNGSPKPPKASAPAPSPRPSAPSQMQTDQANFMHNLLTSYQNANSNRPAATTAPTRTPAPTDIGRTVWNNRPTPTPAQAPRPNPTASDVGRAIWNGAASQPVGPSAAPAPANHPGVLGLGSTGPQVSDLQRKLGINADGIYGPQTQAAVHRYQQTNGLQAHGLADPQTVNHINTRNAAAAPTNTAVHTQNPVNRSSIPAPALSPGGTSARANDSLPPVSAPTASPGGTSARANDSLPPPTTPYSPGGTSARANDSLPPTGASPYSPGGTSARANDSLPQPTAGGAPSVGENPYIPAMGGVKPVPTSEGYHPNNTPSPTGPTPPTGSHPLNPGQVELGAGLGAAGLPPGVGSALNWGGVGASPTPNSPAGTGTNPNTGNGGGPALPKNNQTVPTAGDGGSGSTTPPGGATGTGGLAGAGSGTGGPTGAGTGAPAGTDTGAGLNPADSSTMGGNPLYDPNGITGMLQAYIQQMMNGQAADVSQWQTQAQQQAAADYLQQQTAWQKYIDQLKSQEGLTDKQIGDQLNSSLNTLNDKSFQDYLQGREDMASRGLAGSGLDSAQNTQLALAAQQQSGQLQNQASSQTFANDTSYNNQIGQTQSQMDTLDPQALYDKYYQSLSQAGQQANQQQLTNWLDLFKTAAPYLSPTADQYGNNSLATYIGTQGTVPKDQATAQAALDKAANDWYISHYGTVPKDQADAQAALQNVSNQFLKIQNDAVYQQGLLSNDKYKADIQNYAQQQTALYHMGLLSNDEANTNIKNYTAVQDTLYKQGVLSNDAAKTAIQQYTAIQDAAYKKNLISEDTYKNNIAWYTAQINGKVRWNDSVSLANYRQTQSDVAEGKLALQAKYDAATLAQKKITLDQAQQKINLDAEHYAQQYANTAEGHTVTALDSQLKDFATQMDTALNDNKPDIYKNLYAQWLKTYNQLYSTLGYSTSGSGSGSSSGTSTSGN